MFTCLGAVAIAQIPAHATSLNPSFPALWFQLPSIAQQGDVVSVFAHQLSTVTSAYQARSEDGGRTWPIRERLLGTFEVQGTGALAAGDLVLLGFDNSQGPVLLRSPDAGNSWSSPIRIAATHVSQYTGYEKKAAMQIDGTTIVVTWLNARANGRVWGNRSTDGGITWLPTDQLLDATPATYESDITLVGSGAQASAFWRRGINGVDQTAHQHTADGGLSWLPGATVPQQSACSGVAGDGTYFVLGGTLTGLRSTDGGATWNPITGFGPSVPYKFAAAGSRVLAVGEIGSASAPTYILNTSFDSGATWQVNPMSVPAYQSFTVDAYIVDNASYVHMHAGFTPGHVIVSPDGGLTWQLASGMADLGFGPGPRRTIHLASGQTYGPQYAFLGVGHSLLAAGASGTGGITPHLTEVGLPLQGQTTTLQVDDAVGGSLGVLGVSFAAPAPTLLFGATIWLASPLVTFAFATGGQAGVGGSGAFGLPVAIPWSSALAGTSFVSQAVVLDAGAASGFAVANALETWVR